MPLMISWGVPGKPRNHFDENMDFKFFDVNKALAEEPDQRFGACGRKKGKDWIHFTYCIKILHFNIM